jgi:hypothetical protein
VFPELIKAAETVFCVCATCGNTYDAAPPQRRGICITSSENFLKIY